MVHIDEESKEEHKEEEKEEDLVDLEAENVQEAFRECSRVGFCLTERAGKKAAERTVKVLRHRSSSCDVEQSRRIMALDFEDVDEFTADMATVAACMGSAGNAVANVEQAQE